MPPPKKAEDGQLLTQALPPRSAAGDNINVRSFEHCLVSCIITPLRRMTRVCNAKMPHGGPDFCYGSREITWFRRHYQMERALFCPHTTLTAVAFVGIPLTSTGYRDYPVYCARNLLAILTSTQERGLSLHLFSTGCFRKIEALLSTADRLSYVQMIQ